MRLKDPPEKFDKAAKYLEVSLQAEKGNEAFLRGTCGRLSRAEAFCLGVL